jgi:predicted P-loop ATPase
VFIGTTNRFEYLKDATGGRRFWPVRCGTIDTDALSADRDQLFAEALHLYREGESWWPTDTFERDVILPEQESRSDEDPWTGSVEAYLEKDGQSQVLVKDILLYGLHVGAGRQNRASSDRVTAILQRLGWQRSTKKIKGYHPWIRP